MNVKTEKFEAVQAVICERLKTTGLNMLAKQLQISPAQLSNFRDGKFEDVSEAMTNKLHSALRIATWKIRETEPFRLISALCIDARENQRMVAISAYTGVGKTVTLEWIQAHEAEAFYVLCTSVMSQREFLRAIQKGLGIDREGSKTAMIDAICQKLISASAPLLMLDDAGKLSDPNLRLLQIIYDSTKGAAGIVIAGTEYLKKNIEKRARTDSMGFRELKRRIGYWLTDLATPSPQFISACCSDYGITDPASLKFIIDRATDYGTVYNIITNAAMAAQRTGAPVTRELLAQLHVSA